MQKSIFQMKTAKGGYIFVSSVLIIFGLLLILFPEFSVDFLSAFIAIAMIVFGIIKIVGYYSKDLFRLAFQYDLAFGILIIALGILILVRPGSALEFLSIGMGVAIVADGMFKVQIAADSRRFGIGKWWIIMLTAILTGCVGLLLVFKPFESMKTIMVLLGIALLIEGVLNLITVLTTVKIVSNQQPDVIEGRYKEL